MELKLFGLELEADGCEIVLRDDRYFVHYDVSPPYQAWREDELSEDDAYQFGGGKFGATQVLARLRERLGAQAQVANWMPPQDDPDADSR